MKHFSFSDKFNDIGLGEEDNFLSEIRKEKRSQGIEPIDLINSNPTKVGLIFPSDIISHNIDSSTVADYEPTPSGLASARNSIAEYYQKSQISIDPLELIITSSTSESYSYLFKLLTNPNDEILIPTPGYPLFSFLTRFENLDAREYPLLEDKKGNWFYSFQEMKKHLTIKTKAVILVNPANPTGSYLSQMDWWEWMQWSKENQIPLIVDEVFSPYLFSDEMVPSYPISKEAPIFVLNGISKLLALPQMKLGWIHVQGDPTFKKQAIAGLELLADTYLSVNTPIQRILPELLKWSPMIQNQIKNRMKRNISAAQVAFSENSNLTWKNGNAGWYGWLEILNSNYKSSEELAEQILVEGNIYLHPGEWYGFPEDRLILIFSLIVPEDQFLGGLKVLTSLLK
jgi:aspartate/methionine/tyrosine aminotransferase